MVYRQRTRIEQEIGMTIFRRRILITKERARRRAMTHLSGRGEIIQSERAATPRKRRSGLGRRGSEVVWIRRSWRRVWNGMRGISAPPEKRERNMSSKARASSGLASIGKNRGKSRRQIAGGLLEGLRHEDVFRFRHSNSRGR